MDEQSKQKNLPESIEYRVKEASVAKVGEGRDPRGQGPVGVRGVVSIHSSSI